MHLDRSDQPSASMAPPQVVEPSHQLMVCLALLGAAHCKLQAVPTSCDPHSDQAASTNTNIVTALHPPFPPRLVTCKHGLSIALILHKCQPSASTTLIQQQFGNYFR